MTGDDTIRFNEKVEALKAAEARITALESENSELERKLFSMAESRDGHSAERDSLQSNARTLREALEDISVRGCGMLNQPAAMNGPEEAWLRRRISEYERRAKAALEATVSLDLGTDWRAQAEKLAGALEPLVTACEEDFTNEQTETICRDSDDSSVAASSIGQSMLTFGHIRTGRAALSDYRAKGGEDD